MIPFKKLFTTDEELRRVQDNVAVALQDISRSPWMGGVILTGVAILGGSVDVSIDHGLQRVPFGFLILNKNASTDVWTSATSNPRPELTMILKSTNTVTATVWIF